MKVIVPKPKSFEDESGGKSPMNKEAGQLDPRGLPIRADPTKTVVQE